MRIYKHVLLHIEATHYKLNRENQKHHRIKNQSQLWPTLPLAVDIDIRMPKEVTHTGDQMSSLRQV